MENRSRIFNGAMRATGTFGCESQIQEDWRLARAEQHLQLVRRSRVNTLLIGRDSVIQDILDQLQPDFPGPIATWCPGERLVPPVGPAGTMILYDVSALTLEDQRRLLEWTGRTAGRTRIVSTSQTPLLPSVQAGAFLETLYYRLNTVCVDVSVECNQLLTG